MKVLLLDDHPLFRKGIADLLLDGGIVSGIVESERADEAIALLSRQTEIEGIFLDLQLPDMDGLAFLSQLRQCHIPLPVLVLSANTEASTVDYALRAGANAYLAKSALADEIIEAWEVVQRGGSFIGHCLRQAVENYRLGLTDGGRPLIHLTHRQRQVLQCLGEGLSNQKIAATLKISESTVKGHVSTLFSIFAVDNRTQCVQAAKQHHLLV